jgi:hypothetical protein
MNIRHALLFGLAAPLFLGIGCSSVPDVIFVDDAPDGSVTLPDGAVVPADAGGDAAKADTGTKPDASTPDSSTASNCPQKVPSGYDACCGTVPCAGDDCRSKCSECQRECDGDEGCCAKRNNVVCRPRSSFMCN